MLATVDIVLKPFVWGTNIVSGSQYPTIGMAYFAIIHIQDFLEDSTNINVSENNVTILVQLKQLLLKQIEKYFFENEEQWNMAKVRIFVLIYLIKNILYIKELCLF